MGSESIRFFYSGAAADGGTQTDPNASLGAFRSSTRAPETAFTQPRRGAGIRLIWVDPQNLEPAAPRRTWFGRVLSGRTFAQWSPDAADPGAFTFIGADGEYALPGAVTPSRWAEASATYSLLQSAQSVQDVIEVGIPYHRLFSAVSAAQAAAGVTRYRALFVKNVGAGLLTNVAFGVMTGWLAASNLSSGYAAAGAVTVKSARDLDAAGWPEMGGVWNVVSDEVLYYSSRTRYELIVPAAGRSFLGSAAAAGNPGDEIRWRPMYRVGDEAPGGGGSIQSIADEFTAPIGVTFERAWDDAMVSNLGDLAAGAMRGYWLREDVPAGAGAGGGDHFQGLIIQFDE